MEPQGRGNVPALHTPERNKRLGLRKTTLESRGHVQTVGLNAETTTCRHRADGEEGLLTFPFIGLVRFCALIRVRRDKPAWRCVQGRLAYSVRKSLTRAKARAL